MSGDSFALPALPWKEDALAPHISAETISYHYGKHHAGYVKKLNAATKGKEEAGWNLERIIKNAPAGKIFNCAAQIWNHTFYWNCMGPNCGGEPTGEIAKLIDRDFGSFANFKEQFSAAAAGHFGSGWAWLVQDQATKKLSIVQTHDAGNPIRTSAVKPILTCDVWEHAYYIDYRNGRGSYINAWWSLVNWGFANKQLLA